MVETGRTQIIKWTTEGIVKNLGLVFYDVEHTLVAGNMIVFFLKCALYRKARWYRGSCLFVLDRLYSVKDFFI